MAKSQEHSNTHSCICTNCCLIKDPRTTKISKFDLHTFLNCKGFCRNPCSVNLPIRGQTLNFGLISKFRFKKTDWTFGKCFKFWFWTFKKLLSDEFDFYIHSKYWMHAIWIFVYWNGRSLLLKFIYSEKATKFCEISTVDLSYILQSNLWWRFRKIMWPSQNIWTLLFYDDLAI